MGIAIFAAVSMCIAALVLGIVKRKTKNPARTARVFAFVALALGIIHIFCDFYPFEYTGEGGIDYIGQALVWGFLVDAVLYSTLAAYLSFAILATVYAVKAAKTKDKAGKNWLTLVITWICALVVVGLVTVNIVSSRIRMKNISVQVQEVTQTTDTDGNQAVLVVMELKNDTKNDIYYLGCVYDEITQNGRELPHATLNELIGTDTDIERVRPGSSVIVKKAFKLDDPDEPVHILCRTYGGDFIYVDDDFEIE